MVIVYVSYVVVPEKFQTMKSVESSASTFPANNNTDAMSIKMTYTRRARGVRLKQ